MKCGGVCTEDLGSELGVTCAHCRSVITSQKSSSNFSAMLSRNRTWLYSTFTHFALLRGSWSEPGCSNVHSPKGQPLEGGSSPSRARPFGPTGVPDRRDQPRCDVALVEEGICALLERLAPGGVAGQVGEDQHLRVGPLALDPADRFEPAEAGHHDVHDDDVRPFLADERDSHFTVGRFTGQRQVGVLPQDERHQPTTVHLVIDDENPWCRGRAPGEM